ncbi:MAG TPA: HPr family phosphocarrier protein [Symbiobacteriaceae bacterium]|nr:HPr family phosphocarrier protein [Symbiobacteriaceae bacterium]
MTEKQVTLGTALHLRPASLLVQAASKFKGTVVKLVKDSKEADCRSAFSLVALGAGEGTIVTIQTEGPQEMEALAALAELAASKFGEW